MADDQIAAIRDFLPPAEAPVRPASPRRTDISTNWRTVRAGRIRLRPAADRTRPPRAACAEHLARPRHIGRPIAEAARNCARSAGGATRPCHRARFRRSCRKPRPPLVFATRRQRAARVVDAARSNTVLASPAAPAVPNGEAQFVEDRTGPPAGPAPLWERDRSGRRRRRAGLPRSAAARAAGAGSGAISAGVSVDKAPLAGSARLPGIEHRREAQPSTRRRSASRLAVLDVVLPGDYWRWSSAGWRPAPAGILSARLLQGNRPRGRGSPYDPGSTLRHLHTTSTS